MTKPITPDEARAKIGASIPDEVFAAFNDLIAENMSVYGEAVVLLKDAIARIRKNLNLEETAYFPDHRWLDVEQSYRASGWMVEFDKPGFNETYNARYIFTASQKKAAP